MDNTQFALMEDNRPQQRIADQDAQNQQVLQNVLQGAQIFGNQANERTKLAQDKQLSMAQMAQNQSQFTALQDIQQKELGLNQQRSMAEIAQANASIALSKVQLQQQQSVLDTLPKMHANQAFISQVLADPKAKDPATGSDYVTSQLANAPYPDAITDLDRKDVLATNDLRLQQSATGIAFKANLTNQLGLLNEALSTPGVHIQDYMTNKNGNPSDPTSYNMSAVGQAVTAARINQQQNIIKLQGDQRLAVAQVQAGARTDLGRTRLKTLSDQAIALGKAADAVSKQFPPATPAQIAAARQRAEAAQQAYSAAMQAPPADGEDSSSMATPGATGANMQNPSGQSSPTTPVPNAAQAAWINNLGSNGQ